MKFRDYDSFACIKCTWEEQSLVIGIFLSRAVNPSAHLQHTASRERRGVTVATLTHTAAYLRDRL